MSRRYQSLNPCPYNLSDVFFPPVFFQDVYSVSISGSCHTGTGPKKCALWTDYLQLFGYLFPSFTTVTPAFVRSSLDLSRSLFCYLQSEKSKWRKEWGSSNGAAKANKDSYRVWGAAQHARLAKQKKEALRRSGPVWERLLSEELDANHNPQVIKQLAVERQRYTMTQDYLQSANAFLFPRQAAVTKQLRARKDCRYPVEGWN